MTPVVFTTLMASCCCAAMGQIFLKVGANGQTAALGLANIRVVAGLALYCVGAALWVVSLRDLPLLMVYPFTLLTLALVFVASIFVLGERPSLIAVCGWVVVCIGIAIVAMDSRS